MTRYVGELHIDIGEKVHVKCIVKPKCNQDIPFVIRNARYELYNPMGEKESDGECSVSAHELDVLIQPKGSGSYKLRYIYEVADEIWVDWIRIKVS